LASAVYFHLGLHKTATSWLQRQVFPKLPLAVHRTRKFEKISDIIQRSERNIIISHEGLGGRISVDKAPGDALDVFISTLDQVAQLSAAASVLIGFREHVAWINSAYAQRARKGVLSAKQYRDSFSSDDLSWMQRVRLCERYGLATFFFLYEELAYHPTVLLADLCKFLGTSVPPGMADALAQRENSSPKTKRGLRIARAAYGITRAIGGLPLVNTKKLRSMSSELGLHFDSKEEPGPNIEFPVAQAERLALDWKDLVGMVGARRQRDLSALLSASGMQSTLANRFDVALPYAGHGDGPVA
jgi:hypothetical protein